MVWNNHQGMGGRGVVGMEIRVGGGGGGAKTQGGGPELTTLACCGSDLQRVFFLTVTLMNDY